MNLTVRRDLDEVAEGVARWLSVRRGEDVSGAALPPPRTGYSSETLLLRVSTATDQDEGLVVRLPPAGPGIFPVYDLHRQAAAQNAVAAHGIPAPAPAVVEDDPAWVGSPFLVMPRVHGHVAGETVLADPFMADAPAEQQRTLQCSTLDALADVHRIDWRADALDGAIPVRDLDAELEYWWDYLDWYADGADPSPRLRAALQWCREQRPDAEPPAALLWGDVRFGNIIFDEARHPRAILDWEMTTIGAPEHDLGWFLALEGMTEEFTGRRIGGFLDHDGAVAHYAARYGRSPIDLDYFEVLALVRSTCVYARINLLDEAAGRRGTMAVADNPLLDLIERRIAAVDR